MPQPVKLDLNKKLNPKQKTIQAFSVDAKEFRKTRNENPPTWEKVLMAGTSAGTG